MNKIIIGVVVLIALVLIFSGLNNEDSQEVVNNQENNTVSESENSDINGGLIPEADDSEQLGNISGLYAEYAGDLTQYEDKDIVLFFKADWCPSCRVLDSNIQENLNDIPEDVVLLELDYDTETELKKKYGVTTQHTMVQVDTSGEMIKKWSGGNRLEDVLNQID